MTCLNFQFNFRKSYGNKETIALEFPHKMSGFQLMHLKVAKKQYSKRFSNLVAIELQFNKITKEKESVLLTMRNKVFKNQMGTVSRIRKNLCHL